MTFINGWVYRRHEVADDSFGFVLPGVVEASPAPPTPAPPTPAAPTPAAPTPAPPPPPSIPRSEPNTSAKRRRLNPEAAVASSQPPSSAIRSPPRSSTQLSGARADPYSALEDDSPENVPESSDAPIPASEEPQVEDGTTENIPDVIRSPEPPSFVAEEVTESPAHAPGSGQRRSIRVPESLTQSARLLKAATDEDGGPTGEFELSSPLARKSRASAATTIAASARSTRTGLGVPLGTDITKDVIEEVSPVPPPRQTSDGTTVTKPTRSTRSQNRVATPSEVDQLSSPPEAAGTSSARKPKLRVKSKPIIESAKAKAKGKGKGKEIVKGKGKGKEVEVEAQEEEAEVENEVAEEVNIQTAAKTIGRKRPRVSVPREASPELHSKDVEDVEDVRPAKKSKQRRVQASPAKQSKPKAPKSKDKPSKRRRSDGEAIPIIVQRYTKRMHLNEGDSDADILNADIPFANRGGVNVIDVLAQVCEEVIDSSLETLHEAAVNAKDPSSKKEFRTKLRALEAFQEELRTRLLEHVSDYNSSEYVYVRSLTHLST